MNIEQLESFNLGDAVKFHNKLNPLLWDKGEKLHPEIREQLLSIAADFSDFIGVDNLNLKDITISGSNAAFSYTPKSDIDLHLIVDLGDEEHKDIFRELFDAKKFIYNTEHKITIKGIPVELYVQDADQEHHSQGIYSILHNDWLQIPKRRHADIDDMSVRAKYKDLSKRIREAIKSKSLDQMNDVMEKIRNIRGAGLAKTGEFGPENLAFKLLRNKGDLKKLHNARKAAKSKELSLKERIRPPVYYGYGHDYLDEVGLTPDGTNPSTCEFANEEKLDEVGLTPDGTNPSTSQFTNEAPNNDKNIIQDFIDFCTKELNLNRTINLRLRRDPQWSIRNKTFGRYNNELNELEVGVAGRHIMDTLRTVAHELVHQRQHEISEVPDNAGEDGSPQENEANAGAGILMRKYGKLHPELFAGEHVNESLEESVEDEKFLQQIGNAVERWAQKYKSTNKERINGFVEPGTLGQITGIKGKTPAQKHLLNLGMMFFLLPKTGGSRPLGAYRPAKGDWGGDIAADVRYLIPDATLSKTKAGQEFTHTLTTHETDLGSTVVHELRHALDDYLSKGKYDSSAHKFDYHDQNVEINAFFTQALKSLQHMIDDGIVDQDNLQWAMRRVFYNNELISNLIANKDPRVKRLFSRAYTYLQAELNKDKKLQEAVGYIPTEAEKNDPRFEMAITVDVQPGEIGRCANAFLLNTDSQGHPQELRPDGLVKRMMNEYLEFKAK